LGHPPKEHIIPFLGRRKILKEEKTMPQTWRKENGEGLARKLEGEGRGRKREKEKRGKESKEQKQRMRDNHTFTLLRGEGYWNKWSSHFTWIKSSNYDSSPFFLYFWRKSKKKKHFDPFRHSTSFLCPSSWFSTGSEWEVVDYFSPNPLLGSGWGEIGLSVENQRHWYGPISQISQFKKSLFCW